MFSSLLQWCPASFSIMLDTRSVSVPIYRVMRAAPLHHLYFLDVTWVKRSHTDVEYSTDGLLNVGCLSGGCVSGIQGFYLLCWWSVGSNIDLVIMWFRDIWLCWHVPACFHGVYNHNLWYFCCVWCWAIDTSLDGTPFAISSPTLKVSPGHSWSVFPSVVDLMVRYMTVWTVNSLTLEVIYGFECFCYRSERGRPFS